MEIGNRIKNLRIQKNLTQEELAERTDLSKGYISQVERDLSMPSMEVFFDMLEVLGCTPKDFFDESQKEQRVVYTKEDRTFFEEIDKQYVLEWLVPESNENEMEPILLRLQKNGSFKEFGPSLAETFAFVQKGAVCIEIGMKRYYAKEGEAIYYHASDPHQIFNDAKGETELLMVVTDSYL
ncbi:helix-turn-helix domain-containing protein [Pisciglobus halotolerans]|uniref:Transcriptional regulator, contains XRE-family HTH domain n=1 Tax=Pisciglobus halotolerans TaxID=745365 RepID=A0A1I3B2D2_9LACT|nr:XRE family transcriptional regulator [Pisciglobus halotolerans]SFH56256.1 Transcriptional regulator, contains XRE-family HTH domain [Pisciglobus halotolerans]